MRTMMIQRVLRKVRSGERRDRKSVKPMGINFSERNERRFCLRGIPVVRRVLSVLMIVLVSVFFMSWGSYADNTANKGATYQGAMKKSGGDMDSKIEKAAKDSFVFKTYLKDQDVNVKSNNGVVTLTGKVKEEFYKTMAGSTVAEIPGVKRVDNQLEVTGESVEKGSDIEIRNNVVNMLRVHRNIDIEGLHVDVKDGKVTIHGEADSQAEKGLVTELVKDVNGVKDVNNEMTVVKTPKHRRSTSEWVDDASIKAQIKWALMFHRGTSAFETKVHVNRGIVTVTGKADSAAEKELVTKRIENIRGVNKIINNMTVEKK